MAAIAEKYQSLEEPRFEFVADALAERPYSAIVQSLAKLFEVAEDTDANDDVSFGYLLSKGREHLFLQLSMVGPYAILRRLLADGTTVLLDPDRSTLSAFERSVTGVLEQAAMTVLGENALSHPIGLRLFNTTAERVKVYQALFSDADALPWSAVAP
ncbi:MAG TPA: hypothetical protein VFW87_25880 [Pirellulales bacterium]|nr:hypothetical protein [Pirellulales bacterium]